MKLWKLLVFSLALLLTALQADSDVNAQNIYVSSSTGSDSNTGLSPESPLRTIAKASKNGMTIYLKAGDVFYEHVVLRNQRLTRYGEGKNPEIRGLKRLDNPEWKEVKNNIWCIDLTKGEFSGFSIEGSALDNNIGCLYEYETDQIHCRKVQTFAELQNDWDLWQTDVFDKNAVAIRYDKLYLYYTGNPNQLRLDLTVGGGYGISCHDSDVDRVNVIGFGMGGINIFGSSNVRGCRVDIIGGSTMTAGDYFAPFGNGIDFWVSRDAHDCIIEDCYISRCYDCGCSIQARHMGKAKPSNIIFRNNLIVNCCQAWEDFLRNDPDVMFEDCYFKNNIAVNCGDSPFGYSSTRKKYCNLLGANTDGDRGMNIVDNVFIGGNYYCSYSYNKLYRSNKWKGNKHYTIRGNWLLCNPSGLIAPLIVPTKASDDLSLKMATNEVIDKYRELTGDYSTKFFFQSEKKIQRKGNRAVKKYLSKHQY